MNKDAERALISATVAASEIPVDVPVQDFYFLDNQKIWAAVLEGNLDAVTIHNHSNVKFQTIVDILMVEAPFWKVREFADIVKEEATKRRLKEVASWIVNKSMNGMTPNEVIAVATKDLNELSTVNDAGRSIAEGAADVMDGILENVQKRQDKEKIDYGLQTGVGKIDTAFRGLQPGWLVYLAGSPGIGKSMLALQWGLVFAKQSPGCYIALEMSESSLLYRAYAMRTGDDPTDIEFGDIEPDKIISAYEKMEDLDMDIFCPPRLDIQELKAYISKQKADRNIKWVILDYVSLVSVPRSNDKVADDEFLSQELRKIASEYNIMLLGLDSVTKAGATGMMSLEAIRGSFTKQHDSDVSFGLARYKDDDMDKNRLRNCRVIDVLKDRHRGNGGKYVELELVDGLIDELELDEKYVAEDYTV